MGSSPLLQRGSCHPAPSLEGCLCLPCPGTLFCKPFLASCSTSQGRQWNKSASAGATVTPGACWQGTSCAWTPVRNLFPKSPGTQTSFAIAQRHQPADALPFLPAGIPWEAAGERIVASPDAVSQWDCSDTSAPSPKAKHNPGVGNQFPVPEGAQTAASGPCGRRAAVSNHHNWGWEWGPRSNEPQSPWGGRGCANGVSALQGLAGLVPPAAHPPPGPAPHLHLRALSRPPLPSHAYQIRLPELM